MKRLVYLVMISMLLIVGGIVNADGQGCDNGHGNAHSQAVRGCDTGNSENPPSSNGQNSNSGHGASHSQAANNGSSNNNANNDNGHAANANNDKSAPPAHSAANSSCNGLQNALMHKLENNPAIPVLVRNLLRHGCDQDGDGVIDLFDQCPDTAVGVEVGADGCPNADSDGDGVPDVNNDGSQLDQCPDTPEGATVDETGCPIGQPDLVIAFFNEVPANNCTIDGCTLTVNFTVTNVGDGDVISDFDVSGDATPTGTNTVTMTGGLAAGASVDGTIEFGPGPNCFDPDCDVSLTVDSANAVSESDETNNTISDTWLG